MNDCNLNLRGAATAGWQRYAAAAAPDPDRNQRALLLVVCCLLIIQFAQSASAGTHIWNGASTNGFWATAGNWQGSSAPAINESPLHLVFPTSAARRTMTNNFSGLAVDTLTFQGGTWNLHGSGANASLSLRDLTGLSVSNIGVTAGAVMVHSTVPFVLTGENAFSVNTNSTLAVSNVMSGAGGFAKLGAGELLLNGVLDNTYAGPTYVVGGTLSLRKTFVFGPYIAVPGPLFVGLNELQTDPALRPTVQFLSNEQIADNAPVTIRASGRLLLKDHTQTIGPLAINSGELDTGTNGLLKLTTNITSTNIVIANTPLAGSLKGRVDLGNVARSFRVESHALNVYASIFGQTNAILEKMGAQVLRLFGSNSYAGITVVREGVIAADHVKALGANTSPTIVSNGAALWLEGGINILEPLFLNGFAPAVDGVHGALHSFGTNICSSEITLAKDSCIATPAAADHLTISGRITGPGGWEKRGAGTIKISGGFTGANDYGGITRVQQGTLVLDKALGNVSYLAVPGALEIGLPAGGGPAKAEFKREGEVTATAPVTLGAQGALVLNDGYSFVGSIAGNGTIAFSPAARLFTGFNDANTAFDGTLTGGAADVVNLLKYGIGTFDLGGVNQLAGQIQVRDGGLRINSVQPGARVEVFPPAALGGTGSVSNIMVHAFSVIAPGANIGKLRTSIFTNDGTHSLHIDLNGAMAGTGHDQLEIDAAPSLARTALKVNVGANFHPTNEQRFVVLKNNDGGPLTERFLNLADGDTVVTDSGHFFSISYNGGDGNDVELSLLADPPRVPGIQVTPSKAVVTALGIPGVDYWVEATSNLGDPNGWVSVAFITADGDGFLTFEDFDTPSFPQRFYRFLIMD